MYMALTEEQAREIRKLGITVIEWKWCVKENVNVFIYIMNKAIGKATGISLQKFLVQWDMISREYGH